MKPVVNDKKCGASMKACKALRLCPVGAISYIEIDEAVSEKNVDCSGGCDCGEGSCGGSPFGRIVIDYGKCTGCGVCVDECCGGAIDME